MFHQKLRKIDFSQTMETLWYHLLLILWSSFWFTDTYKIHTGSNVEPVLSLVPQCKGSGIAQIVETSNAESPTHVYVYRKHSWHRTMESFKANKGCIQYTSWCVLHCFVFDKLCCELPDSYTSKPKRTKTPYIICMSVQPLSIKTFDLDADVQRYNVFLLYDSKSQKN